MKNNLDGKRIGEWTILIDRIRIEGNKKHQYAWAKCSCGIYRLIDRHAIYNSCGHIRDVDGIKYHVPEGFQDYYLEHSLLECVNNYGVSEWIVGEWAKHLGLSKVCKRGKDIKQELTNRQLEIINGSLLGDAFLSKIYGNKNSSFGIRHGEKQLEYLKWMHNELHPFSCETTKEITSQSTIEKLRKLDNSNVRNEIVSYHFDTVHIPIFTELEHKWYLRDNLGNYILNNLGQRIKIVPEDIKLTPLTIAVWFYDDGYNRPAKREACFCTQSFTKNECLSLVDKLLNFNIKSNLNSGGKPGQFIIRVLSSSYLDFINIIKEQVVCETMNYKKSLDKYKPPNYSTRFNISTNKKLNDEKVKKNIQSRKRKCTTT